MEQAVPQRRETKSSPANRLAALALAGLLPLLRYSLALAGENPTAAFLKIPVDARAVGLGGGITAVAEGVGALSQNPAGFGFARRPELSLLYAAHLQGSSLGYLAYGRPTRLGSLGVSHLNLRSGALDGRDDEGRPTGSFSAEDRAIGVSWAAPLALTAPLIGRPAIGVHAKYITSRIGSYQASTYAFDIGAQSSRRVGSMPARLGLALRNLGPGLTLQGRKDPLPLQVGFGASVQPLGMLTVTAGGSRYLVGEQNEFSLGAELTPLSGFFFRGNYGMFRGGSSPQALPQLSWGIGMRLSLWQIDYAFMPLGELGSTQRLNLTMRFGTLVAVPALSAADRSIGLPQAQSLAQLAWESLKEGRLAAAAVHFQRALDAEPGDRRLASLAARAQEAAVELPSIEGGAAWSVLARRGAAAYVDGRDPNEAVLFLRQAYEQSPEDARLLNLLNLVERAAKVGELTAKPALSRAAGFVEERLRRAKNAIYDGQYQAGASLAQEALQVDAKNVQGWAILGSARYLQGSRAGAREAWERALALNPGNQEVTESLEKIR